jgi:hypothetical protein
MNYTIPTNETAPEASLPLYANLEKAIGFLPNLYAYIGHSSNALQTYLAYQTGNAKGVHTALGKMNGFTDEEIIQLRTGTHPDEKLNVLTNLSADIQRTQGHPSQTLLDRFFGLGYDQAALVDLIALVTDKVFANYLNNIVQTPIDFPVAPVLETAQKGA